MKSKDQTNNNFSEKEVNGKPIKEADIQALNAPTEGLASKKKKKKKKDKSTMKQKDQTSVTNVMEKHDIEIETQKTERNVEDNFSIGNKSFDDQLKRKKKKKRIENRTEVTKNELEEQRPKKKVKMKKKWVNDAHVLDSNQEVPLCQTKNNQVTEEPEFKPGISFALELNPETNVNISGIQVNEELLKKTDVHELDDPIEGLMSERKKKKKKKLKATKQQKSKSKDLIGDTNEIDKQMKDKKKLKMKRKMTAVICQDNSSIETDENEERISQNESYKKEPKKKRKEKNPESQTEAEIRPKEKSGEQRTEEKVKVNSMIRGTLNG
jgi:hypothetical protein